MGLAEHLLTVVADIGDQVAGVVAPVLAMAIVKGMADRAVTCVVAAAEAVCAVIHGESLSQWHAVGSIAVGGGDVVAASIRLGKAAAFYNPWDFALQLSSKD